ncbi:magnesium/cobalt transporter CorA, partial [Gemella morbillorum]|uniref:magnesium/cobalt transporter CorA n=2 Tax=Gemella TaxID=1378 RepID=UPI00248E596E
LVSEIVEGYIPIISKIENRLDEIEESDFYKSGSKIMDEVFELRGDLLKLRRGLRPMREVLHRFLVSRRVEMTDNDRKYFHDIYDDLVQQTEIIEANRELASDIRENFMTYNSLKSNNIMMTLTVISTIFLPLTFIVGLYGMNFDYMPELKWKYGYFIICALMLGVAVGMLWFFKKKGWLDMFK